MTATALAPLARLKQYTSRAPHRRLRRCPTLDDLERAARRRLPRRIFWHIAGGAEDERALRRNRSALAAVRLRPRLRDVTDVDLRTRLLGEDSAFPFALAPTGLTRIAGEGGELAVARAADRTGIPYTASTVASTALGTVAEAATRPVWFQLYMVRDRGLSLELIARARQAGVRVLMVTVDAAVGGGRDRDVRNGMKLPPEVTPRELLEGLRNPTLSARRLLGPPIALANFGLEGAAAAVPDPSVTWETVASIVEAWRGPVVAKGVMCAEEARRAVDAGVAGIVVSNHGGRQLDAAPATIEVLPEVVDAVGGSVEVLMDSGIRRGSDVLAALALGASGCLVGRPYLYGLTVGGQLGVEHAIETLAEELRRTMMLVGIRSVDAIDRRVLASVPKGIID